VSGADRPFAVDSPAVSPPCSSVVVLRYLFPSCWGAGVHLAFRLGRPSGNLKGYTVGTV